jgi:hypothetical protein
MRQQRLREIIPVLVFAVTPAFAQSNPRSCIETAGKKLAKQYAYECHMVAESLQAPCNAKNPCDVMLPIIRKGCSSIHYDVAHYPDFKGKEPAFCGGYLPQP